MTSKAGNKFYIPDAKGLQMASEAETINYPREFSWNALEAFLKQRSLRRIFYVVGGAGVCFAALYLYRRISAKKNEADSVVAVSSVHIPVNATIRYPYEEYMRSNNNADLPNDNGEPPLEDKVVIHCCPRGFYVPSIATEPLKLETFLRVANIPYEVNFCSEFETPFMTYGDKVGNDFRECIRILSENFAVDLETKDVPSSRKTAAHLVDISLETRFAWAILIWRWIFDEGKSLKKIHAMNALGEEVVPEVSMRVKEATKYHPIGQMDRVEFVKTINEGITDIAAALGRHKYIQGQTPGVVDCHAFAILAQLLWNMPGSPFESHVKKFSNLIEFVKRMKEKFWPDWNEMIMKPQEFEELYYSRSLAVHGHHRSSSANSKSRRTSRSQERGETADEKNDLQDIQAASDEEASREKNGDKNLEVRSATTGPGENKFPYSEAVTLPTLKEDLQARNEASQSNDNNEQNQNSQDSTGILKTGATGSTPTTATDNSNVLASPRSGILTASVGSTKFPVDQLHEPSEEHVLMNTAGRSSRSSSPHPTPPLQQPRQQESQPHYQQQTHRRESVFQEQKPTVKFANVPSSESPMVNHQNEQRPSRPQSPQYYSNGNFQATATPPQVGMRTQMYPASADELSKRRHAAERNQNEQIRHSMIPQAQYGSYAEYQRHRMQNNNTVEDYRRVNTQSHVPSQHSQQQQHQYNRQPPTQTSYRAYPQPQQQHPSFQASPQMFANQQIRLGSPSFPQQQLNYASLPPNTEGIQRQIPTYSQPQQQPLNSEQMQKVAQAHLDPYVQQQQRQHYQQQQNQQYPQYQNVNYHPGSAIAPSFVAQPYDPRHPSPQALLRF